ncbi:MAG: LPS assembly protein LptD [Oceanicaulis sp.]
MRALIAGGARRAVLAAALMAAASPLALAQASFSGENSTASQQADQVYLEADVLEQRNGEGVYIARGSVRMVSGERIIEANEIHYNTTTGRVTARGDVRIYEGDQPAQFADEVLLDDAMSEGVAYGFATLLENNGRAAAASALRRPDGSVEMADAYYTACELCEDGGAPTWRLRADRVVRDLDGDMIYYRDVRLEVAGVPVIYSPVFAHADPSAERKSGFLLPRVDISNRLGLSYQQPYLFVISPSQDLVVAPRVMSEVAPLLELDYRKRFYSGTIDVETSLTYEQEFDKDGFFGPEQLRGHIFAEGLFAMSPEWRWGFRAQAASEDLYLRRYDYNEETDESSGLFQFRGARQLISQLFVAGKGDFYYTDVSVAAFDSLFDGFDDDRLPYVTPYWRFAADGELPFSLGDFDIFANAVNLRRELGDDYTRVSVGADWSRPIIAPGGIRIEPFAVGRADAFSQTTGAQTRNFMRVRGAAGVDASYPFVRPGERFDVIVSPRSALVASNGGDPEERPLVQDAVSFDFSRSFLFNPVRSPGFDVFEDGVRVDAGFEVEFDDRREVYGLDAFIGRSYRLAGGDERFGPASGIFEDESDWVADVEFNIGWFEAGVGTRLDSADFDINRIEAEVGFEVWRVEAEVNYLQLSDEASPIMTQELEWQTRLDLTREITAFYDGTYDLTLDEDRAQSAGFMYRDDCTQLRVYWERENINVGVGDLGPSSSVKFEIVLFTLGGVAET